MKNRDILSEAQLATLAKRYREAAGKTRAEAAREMGVKQPSIFHAEETPEQSLIKLRMRMIDHYSPFKVNGPGFWLEKK
ncbi:MAG: helix-turn-helix domain-containing protein [Verrucomicrobia bacterium]|nr:helix-turn-helix domain-containing protein [Verrucomicrobiota bacterium]